MWNFKKFTSGLAAMAVAATAFVAVPISAGAAENLYLIKINDTSPQAASFTNNGVGNTGRFFVRDLPEGQTKNGITASSDCVYAEASGTTSGRYDYDLSSAIGLSTDYKLSYDLAFYSEATTGRNMYIDLYSDNGTKILSFDGHGTKNTYPGVKTFADTNYTTNSSIAINTWYTMAVTVKDGKLSASLKDKNGNSMWSATDVTYDAATQGAISKLSFVYGYSIGTSFLDNIYVSTLENATVDSVEISGNSTVELSDLTATYSAVVKAGQYEVENPSITWAIDSQTAGAGSTGELTITSDGVVTKPENWSGTAVISATSSGFKGIKNVTFDSSKGYVINTTPYAGISIDGGEIISTGREGKYSFALGTTGSHTVEITKDGYQPVSTTITAQDNESTPLMLQPNSGIVYQEDFTYVDDNFGGTNGIINVSNGVLSNAFVNSTTINETVSMPESVDLKGTVTTIRLRANRNDRLGYFSLKDSDNKTPIGFYFRGNDKVYYQNTATSGSGVAIKERDTDYHLYQFYLSTTDDNDHRPVVYIDGVKVNTTLPRTDIRSLDKIYLAGAESNGSTTIMSVDYIKVESLASGNTEPTATVLLNNEDGTQYQSTGYLIGANKTVTLPEGPAVAGKTFTGWSDGTNVRQPGYEFTATESVTYTATYTTNTGTITPKYVAANGTTQLGGTIASNGYGGANGSTIATAFALDTTNVPQETTMTGIAWEINVPNNGAYVRTNNTSNWTKTVEGSPVTYIDSENGIASGVESYNIYPVSTSFTLRLMHQLPHVTGAEVIVGLVVDNLYIPSNSTVTANYITTAYNESDEAYAAYDKLDLGTLADGVYNATVGTPATLSETTAFGELMSIDSILTMMYDEDELAEITGDIASEDNADITGIDDEIDMTDNNDGGEAVGEME